MFVSARFSKQVIFLFGIFYIKIQTWPTILFWNLSKFECHISRSVWFL